MRTPTQTQLECVHELLTRHAPSCDRRSTTQWNCGWGPDMAVAAADCEAGWLRLTACLHPGNPAGGRDSRRRRQLLRRNAQLPAGVRACVASQTLWPVIVADVPLTPAEVLERRLAEACQVIPVALQQARQPRRPADAEPAGPGEFPRELLEAAAATGWAHTRRANGALVFTLEVPDQFVQGELVFTGSTTSLTARAANALNRVADAADGASARSLAAAELLLLTASSAVRMARAVRDLDGFRWEVHWTDQPAAEELQHALCAMSLALRMTLREACALADATIAKTYIRFIGTGASSPVRPQAP